MKVWLSSHLRSYTGGIAEVEATGATLAAALLDLDKHYPGLRFRIIDEQDQIRPHINIYVRSELVRTLAIPLGANDEIHLIGALSGG